MKTSLDQMEWKDHSMVDPWKYCSPTLTMILYWEFIVNFDTLLHKSFKSRDLDWEDIFPPTWLDRTILKRK